MPINQRFLIIKEKDSKEVKYFEYDKISGYGIKPGTKIRDAVNINKMILINPSLIDKMVDKKLNNKFKQLLKLLSIVYETDDETGEGHREILDQVYKFKVEMNNKYRKYMEDVKYDIMLKKLDILEKEINTRLEFAYDVYEKNKEGKTR